VNGSLLSSFTDVKELRHLSLDGGGRVFVVDCSNYRILLLNTQLQLQRVLIGSNNSQLKLLLHDPTRLHYDALTSRLYVVHCSSSKFHPDVISVFSLRWVTDSCHCWSLCKLSNSITTKTFTNARVSRRRIHYNVWHANAVLHMPSSRCFNCDCNYSYV